MMDLNMLFEKFDLLMDSPNSTAKMRELILQLAVQGKLVEQDPNDEPASKLLKRIKTEKEKLIAEGKIKKQKPLPPITDDEIPYELPLVWEWVRLRNVTHIILGQSPPSTTYNTYGEGLPFYQGKADYGKIFPSPTKWCTSPQKVAEAGDVLISVRAPVGPTNICEERSCIGRGLAAIRGGNNVDTFFILYTLRVFEKELSGQGFGSTFTAITGSHLNNFLFPLPSFAEQNRIVAKVDELMQLCDQLDDYQEKASTKYTSLNDAALEKLLSAKTIDEFADHWQFICNNFDHIYNDPAHVNKLRQAILHLSVQGKLAPQDPNDEPASKLLKRIKTEKEKLITKGKIKKQKLLPPITDDEIPYELPHGWEWARLGNLTQVITKGSSPKWQGVQYVGIDEGLLFWIFSELVERNRGKIT